MTRLTLRLQDGSSTDIPLHDRYYVTSCRAPSILEARNAHGGVVYREFFYPRQHCIYPSRDRKCRNFGMGTG